MSAMNSKVATAVDLYRKLSSHPELTSAVFSNHVGEIIVNSVWSQIDLDRSEKVKFNKTYIVSENGPSEFGVKYRKIAHLDKENELWSKESPSGKLTACIKKFTPKKGDEKQFIEIWDQMKKLKQFDVLAEEKHGKICENDRQFGCFAWSADEKSLLYVAEKKSQKTKSFFDTRKAEKAEEDPPILGQEHDFKQDWGEQLVGKHKMDMFILDIDNGSIMTLDKLPDNVSLGQGLWTHDGDNIVFVAWKHEPYRLGLTYCPIRQSVIYCWNRKTSELRQLSEDNKASWLPRLSPDGSKLIYLDNDIGGPHYQCSRLMMYDMKTQKLSVIVDIVKEPKEKECPGIYSMSLPERCWAKDGKRVVFDSEWRSQVAVLVVDIDTKKITPVFCENGGCLKVLDVHQDRLLVAHSSINQLQYISMSTLPKSGQEVSIEFSPLDAPEKKLDINFSVRKFHPKDRPHPKYGALEYEAILVKPSKFSPKHPLIVFPHGGPHSVFPTDFMLLPACFVLSGFAMLYINYRGTIGFGDNSLRSLLGSVGDMDVKDCQEAVQNILENEPIDKEKVAVFGGSHGGFLTTHLIGQYPECYKAACCRNPVTNIASMLGTTDIPDWAFTECGFEFSHNSLSTEEILSAMWQKSPMQYVDKVSTPVLIMLGLDDARVPPKQGQEYYKQLTARNKTARLIGYQGNCHPIITPEASADACINILCWFWKHMD